MANEQITLQTWVASLNGEMDDFELDEESMHIILDLARDAAHHVVRPASPLTTFVVGYLVGRGATLGQSAAMMTERLLDSGGATAGKDAADADVDEDAADPETPTDT